DLERATHAEPPDRTRPHAGDLTPVEAHRAAIGLKLAVEQVEARALAGPIGTDQRQQLSGRQREADVRDGAYAAERLGEMLYGEDAHSAFSSRWRDHRC